MSAAANPGADGRPPSPLRRFLSTACGIGWLPTAPGTWASAATALLLVALFGLRGMSEPLLATAHAAPGEGAWALRGGVLVALALVFVGGLWLGNRAGRDFGVSDPGPFVLDEVVGQGLALLPLLPGPMPA